MLYFPLYAPQGISYCSLINQQAKENWAKALSKDARLIEKGGRISNEQIESYPEGKMGRPGNIPKQILGIAGLIFLGIALFFIFQGVQKNLFLHNATGSGVYPPPTGKQEPTSVIQSSSSPYPVPGLTTVAQNSPIPPSTLVPVPPPGWPTDQPWPPESSMMTSVPTEPLQPFPTPQIIKLTIAESLPKTIQMWFPYYPKADVQPDLRGIKLDERSQKWEIVQLPIKINFPIPLTGPDPGPILVNFHISPNSRWLVADFAYGCSRLIDLLSGTSNSSVDNLSLAGCKFIAWLPNDPQSLIASSQEYSVRGFNKVNIETAQTEPVSFSDLVAEDDQIRAMAYSPDGKNKAVAVVKAAKANVRKNWLATVNLEGNEKRTLADINGGVSFVDDGLQWSPDGKNLIWIVEVWDRKGGSETQLWLADLGNGSTKELAVLGKSVRYNHPPAWSPDGSMIAVLKAGVNQEAGENIFLVNPKTGEEKQITHLVDRQFSHLQWLSDGKWLAFTVSAGEYGEIWMTNLDGSITFPFAGPTLPNAPYILIDVGK